MKFDCREVAYHVKIVGFGEPLLLLHGFTGTAKKRGSFSFHCIVININ